ncbi:MAG: 4-hydroxy-tetrahydrodipicolinate reductase [Steroidobacteraceae bacterium]
MTIRLTILGATGRMGQQLLALRTEFPEFALAGAVCAEGDPGLGRDADESIGRKPVGVIITTDLGDALANTAVVVDFSSAAATKAHLQACVQAGKPMLIGTTGHAPAMQAEFAAAARKIPLLIAPNTSLGVTLLLSLAEQAARAMPEAYDVEIAETHHRHKVDAPSGTALAIGRAVAAGRGTILPQPAQSTGSGRRVTGSVGFSVSRGGDVVGEHQLRFLGTGEQLVLGHIATDRAIFARGALTAASWLAGQRPGAYRMTDVINLKSTA